MRTMLSVALSAALLCSCATLSLPQEFGIPIKSTPPGATVVHRGEVVGTTPCTVVLRREELPTLTLRRDGFHDQPVVVENVPVPFGLVFVDLLLIIPLAVDVANSVDYCLDTSPLSVHLTPTSADRPRIWRRSDFIPAPRK